MKAKDGLFAALIMLGGILLSLLAAELLFRAFGAGRGAGRAMRGDRPQFYYNSPLAADMREQHYQAPKPANTFRVAVVGDSISFGPKMQADDVFAARLERMLNLNGEQKAEVVNYGIPGYSTVNEVNLVKEALTAQADLIILQITLNDPEKQPLYNAQLRFGRYQPSPRLAKIFSWFRLAGFVAERVHNSMSRRAYKDYFFDLFDNRESWRPFERSAKEIVGLAARRNVKVLPVIFPLFGFPLSDQDYPFRRLHKKIADLFASQGVKVLDLYHAYENLPQERLVVVPGSDLHPNEIAHRLASEVIYRRLLKDNLIPETLQIKALYRHRDNLKEARIKGPHPKRNGSEEDAEQ